MLGTKLLLECWAGYLGLVFGGGGGVGGGGGLTDQNQANQDTRATHLIDDDSTA
jgi:hypothetical protein